MPFLRMTPAPGDEHSGLPSSFYQFATHRSAATEGVRALTRALASRPSWISSLMPIREGMIVALWQPGS